MDFISVYGQLSLYTVLIYVICLFDVELTLTSAIWAIEETLGLVNLIPFTYA